MAFSSVLPCQKQYVAVGIYEVDSISNFEFDRVEAHEGVRSLVPFLAGQGLARELLIGT